MRHHRLALAVLVLFSTACAQPSGSPQTPVAPSSEHSTNIQTARQAQLASIGQWLKSGTKRHGSYFLPPYQVDATGNVTTAGIAGFATSAADGTDTLVCAFTTTSEKRFFKINSKEIAMDHVNGPAEASYIRFSSAFDVLEEYVGQGSMNLHVQGVLETIVSSSTGGTFFTMLVVGDPTSSEIWTGGAKVGVPGGPATRDLKCGLRNDSKSADGRSYLDLK